MKYASIGSISHGTLLNEYLLSALSDELKYHVERNPDYSSRNSHMCLVGAAGWIDPDSDNASELVNDLQNALQEYAAPYTYFGTNEGDGSDFGFWPSMDAIEELPHISDPNEVENHLGEDCVFVNDHGNVTVYGADGKVIWDCV